MTDIALTGLDGKNPIAFMAALGVLSVLSDAPPATRREAKLWWTGGQRAVLTDGPDRKDLLEALVKDLASFADEPAIESLRYKKEDGKDAHDLKPKPERFAGYLETLVNSAQPRSLALAAAFATDVAVDRSHGNTKPTALHFTAGQQQFLGMVHDLVRGVTAEDLEEAVFGPWSYTRTLPVLRWDNAICRDYALMAASPAEEKRLGVPGADWLAFRGLPFLRVAPVGKTIQTTGCSAGRSETLRWPLWSVPLSSEVIRPLLSSRELFEMQSNVLAARGVQLVLESDIRRSDKGYGEFSPSRVASPSGRR